MRKEEYSVCGHPSILRGQHTKSQLGVHHWNFGTPSTSLRTVQTQIIDEDLLIYLSSCGKLIYSIRVGGRYIFSMLAYPKSTILLYERIEVHDVVEAHCYVVDIGRTDRELLRICSWSVCRNRSSLPHQVWQKGRILEHIYEVHGTLFPNSQDVSTPIGPSSVVQNRICSEHRVNLETVYHVLVYPLYSLARETTHYIVI